ncbi:MAG: hypothetical protein IJ301_03550 [Clostridia bacterium]|nr:hypothetical protein [Clostridia bacterium]
MEEQGSYIRKYALDKNDYRVLEDGTKVYRIVALKHIPNPIRDIEAGERGGYVQSKDNLDKYSPAWIFDNSIVHGDAIVRGKSSILGDSEISGNVLITNTVSVKDSLLCDNVVACGYSRFYKSLIANDAVVGGYTWVIKSKIWDKSTVFERNLPRRATIIDCVGKYDFKSPEERVAKYLLIPEGDMFRIMALRDIETREGLVKEGELGGLVSSIHNLSQFNTSWIFPDSVVRNNATVQDDAVVMGKSLLEDDVVACEHAKICNCKLDSRIIVGGSAELSDFDMSGNIRIFSSTRVKSGDNLPRQIKYKGEKPLTFLTPTEFKRVFSTNEKQI